MRGWIILGLSSVLLVAAAFTFFLKPKPWVWTYDLVLICFGLSSYLLPVCVPLLIFWIKPETKKHFGRTDA
jgi:F0F1-type ATP synthase assembly protein I